MATVHTHPSAWSKDKPVYSSHRLLKNSTNPSGRHLHAMTGMESIMIRSLSSGCFIAEKEDMVMNPQPRADSSWRACPDYLEVAPVGPARRVRATARFRWHRQRLESRRHLLLTAGEPFSCPRWVRWL